MFKPEILSIVVDRAVTGCVFEVKFRFNLEFVIKSFKNSGIRSVRKNVAKILLSIRDKPLKSSLRWHSILQSKNVGLWLSL